MRRTPSRPRPPRPPRFQGPSTQWLTVLLIALSIGGIALALRASSGGPEGIEVEASGAGRRLAAAAVTAPTVSPSTTTTPSTTPPPTTVATTTIPESTTTTRPVDPLERIVVTVHGDETAIEAERELRLALAPGAVEIDAEAGRSLLGVAPSIAAQARSGLVDVVVIALGRHDGEYPTGYEDLVGGTLDALAHVGCVVWVTADAPDAGLTEVNDAIWRQATRAPHAVVADWADEAASLAVRDAEGRLTPEGRDRYGLLVGGAVRQCLLS